VIRTSEIAGHGCARYYGIEPEFDGTFAYIAGYTGWGYPYGVTWEEMENLEKGEQGGCGEPVNCPDPDGH